MIGVYPTRRAIVLAAAGAPLALAAGVAAPRLWVASLAWVLLAAGLLLVDVLLSPARRKMSLTWQAPGHLGVGRPATATLQLALEGGGGRAVEFAVGAQGPIVATPTRGVARLEDGRAQAQVTLTAARRGPATIDGLWARWTGPLGLAWMQKTVPLSEAVSVVPDIERVREEALRLFSRDAPLGLKAEIERGQGSDFHALREFQQGMDLRSIDWKQSARHGKLVGREYRTERNHPVVLAIDSGRLMSAPIGGMARLDRAINAALLLAFVSLKLGDRVRLFSFDARPRISSGLVAGAAAFPPLQRLAARIAYSAEETNFTLGLNTLSGALDRRSMIVLFTDFVDPTSAELMIENLARLMRRHQVLFVAFRDEEMEAIAEAAPEEADDATRAVIAESLLQQRQSVIARLRRMGALIIDPKADGLGAALINSYLDAKRRELV